MKTDTVCYYYKCPETGIEIHFTKSGGFGWGVSFVNLNGKSRRDIAHEMIPWPKLSTEEQNIVNLNYERLYRNIT